MLLENLFVIICISSPNSTNPRTKEAADENKDLSESGRKNRAYANVVTLSWQAINFSPTKCHGLRPSPPPGQHTHSKSN